MRTCFVFRRRNTSTSAMCGSSHDARMKSGAPITLALGMLLSVAHGGWIWQRRDAEFGSGCVLCW